MLKRFWSYQMNKSQRTVKIRRNKCNGRTKDFKGILGTKELGRTKKFWVGEGRDGVTGLG